MAVIVVSGVGIAIVMKSDSDTDGARNGHTNAEFASAEDVNPANVISEDPTCDAWARAGKAYVAEVERVKWSERDTEIPATEWTSRDRAMYEDVSAALTATSNAADNLKKQTPHRIMRELYGQYIEYARAFVNSVPNYEASDQYLANATSALFSGISAVCSAITYRSVTSFVKALPEYTWTDNYLSRVAAYLAGAVNWACKAAS
ncbi:hypothetical protein [Mycolicibacterium smegmatis]|uniref:hypothetical protein n=1 Tax=Mycolicibacterium smegmatis TaxID=1772 RepID=UPI001303B89A|nr:hypothetical protein [Mycolicibacterium smegmatis]